MVIYTLAEINGGDFSLNQKEGGSMILIVRAQHISFVMLKI
jgi:hypothetical protein